MCTPWFTPQEDTLCTTWLTGLNTATLAGKLTSAQKTALCAGATPAEFNADLNGDGMVNDGDIIIIQLAMQATESVHAGCGAVGQASCQFPSVYVCENLENSYDEPITSCGG